MKKIILIAGGIILVAVAGIGVWGYLQIKTAVVCGSTLEPSCYRYTCTYGIIRSRIGGGVDCIGGPKPIRGEEVAE